jgi:MYXO-CTERM domain-containing protein
MFKGIRFALIAASLMLVASPALGFTTSKTVNQTTNGQNMLFNFTNLPVASSSVYVYVDLYGDYDLSSEYADVWIENVVMTDHTGGGPQCNTTAHRRTYVRSSSIAADRAVSVRVDLSSSVTYSTCSSYAPRVVVTLVYSAKPDLYIFGSTVPYTGATAKAGDTFTARYAIRNLNTSLSTNFYVRFYYCPAASTSGCTYLGAQYISDNFAVNQYRFYTSPTLTLPVQAERGTRYLRTFVDSNNYVAEDKETNNNDYDPITVSAYPNLSFSASTVPYTGNTAGPGAQFTGRYTIANAANSSAVNTNFVVRYYYCTSSSSTSCGATPIGQQTITYNIYSGSSYYYTSTTMTLPATATTGGHYVRAHVDATQVVNETTGIDNYDMDYILVGLQQKPDLSTDNIVINGAVNSAGDTFTVTSRVRNVSGTSLITNFTVRYYACPTQGTSGCTSLGTKLVTTNIAANGNTNVTSPTLTMPNGVPLGTSYIRVFVDSLDVVDEDSESNNNGYKAVSISIKPDLTIVSTLLPKTGTITGPGDTFTADYTIVNAPNTSYFSTDFDVSYYYCPNQAVAGCVLLGTNSVTNDFSAAEKYLLTTSGLTIPATATTGTHYIRAFVDAGAKVAETSEGNNNVYTAITITKGPPDFVVSTFTATASGTTVSYNVVVCNNGETTTDSFNIGLFYNGTTAPSCSASATPDDTFTVASGLAKSACATHNFTQPGTAPGSYTAWAMADHACTVNEGNEGNNTKSDTVVVTQPLDQGVVADAGGDAEIPVDGGIDYTAPADQQLLPDQGPDPDLGTNDVGSTEQDSGPTPDQGAAQTDGAVAPLPGEDGGCCSVGHTSTQQQLWYLLGFLVLVFLGRRRRRRRK